MPLLVQKETEEVTFEPGYRIRFKKTVKHENGDMTETEEEGIISQVKDGGGLVVIVAEDSRLMISFVDKEKVTQVLNKMI